MGPERRPFPSWPKRGGAGGLADSAMNGLAGTWAQFLVCALLIGYAGTRLARYGDIIGQKAGWSANWGGLILLSTVTSLPELATGISAAGYANNPDIAAGDIFGSCAFNLVILAILDALYREKPMFCRVSHGHALSAAFGAALLALTGAALVLGKRLDELALWHVGISVPIVLAAYVLAMRAISAYDHRHRPERRNTENGAALSLRRAVAMYAASAVVVVAAGGWLPFIATRLAGLMGWQDSFVGTLFVAIATSMPELSVSLMALRIGQPDMAVANLLGSNMFNIAILAMDDLVYRPGPLLSHVATVHAVTVFATLLMEAIVIAALLSRPRSRVLGTASWHSIVLITVFALGSLAQFRYGAS
jgi:cation:H+ antiporter